jgi:PST family polysaccharide transporter
VAIPTALIFVRERLTSSLGLSQAGYWQASWRLSDVYLMLITTTLSVYYLPRIAEIRSAREMRAEIFKVYRFVLPVVVVSSLSIFFLRDFIINSLFTPEFSPMRDLFAWQLVGDFVKIGAWVLSYIMLGRAMIRSYVATEVIFSGLFYVLTIVFVKYFGLQGVAIAYAINYFVYWVVLSLLVKIELGRMKGNSA